MTIQYTAYVPEKDEDYIVLKGSDGSEERIELFYDDCTVNLGSCGYSSNDPRFVALMKGLDEYKAKMLETEEQFPNLNKDCTQRIVQLKRTIRNQAGEQFHEGALMVITQRHKKDGTVTLRPLKGGIIVPEDDCRFLGDKADLGFGEYQ